MKFMYSAPCFSGDCGFCAACCDSEDDSSESEVIRRAEDLSKFFGPKKIDKITMNYNSKLKKWCKERGFRNPTDIGWTKETIKVTKKNGEIDTLLVSILLIRIFQKYNPWLILVLAN